LVAFGRGERDLDSGILEVVVRRCELLEPEAGLLPGVAELVVSSQDEKDLHVVLLMECCPANRRLIRRGHIPSSRRTRNMIWLSMDSM
jgi:hypothetical protein